MNLDRICELELENGYVTDETAQKLYNKMDFQRATQAYLVSAPYQCGIYKTIDCWGCLDDRGASQFCHSVACSLDYTQVRK